MQTQKLYDIQSVGELTVIEGAQAAKTPDRPAVLMKVGGTFQRADTKNANNRIYSEALWDRVLDDPNTLEKINLRGMMGEADHPKDGETSIDRVSHVITDLQKRPDKAIYGEAELLDTPRGRIVATIIQAGCRIGISSRGDGSVENRDGTDYVSEDDFGLETFDFVINPSTSGAYPAQLSESAMQNERRILEALKGHVNQAVGRGDVKSLVEAGQIVSKSFEQTAHPALRDQVLHVITEHLDKNPEHNNHEPDSKESDMSKTITERTPPTAGQGTLSETAYAQLRLKETEDKLVEASETIVNLSKEKGELQERVTAAEKLIAEYTKQIDKLNESVESWRDRSRKSSRKRVGEAKDIDNSGKQLVAAKKLIEDLLKRLTVSEDALVEKTREYDAAETLLAEFVKVTEEDGVSSYVDKRVIDERGTPHPQADHIRKVLEGCTTVEDAKGRYETLKPFLTEAPKPRPRSRKEPLPTAKGRQVIESKTKGGKADLKVVESNKPDDGKSAMIGRIVGKCGK